MTSGLVRGFARVDSGGKIEIPRNLLIAMGLKAEDLVELKIVASSDAKKITISKRQNCR